MLLKDADFNGFTAVRGFTTDFKSFQSCKGLSQISRTFPGVAYLMPPTLMTTGWSAGPVGGSKPSDFSAQEEGREVSWA